MKKLRSPIVTVSGHVDHGKTSILDCLRNSCVQKDEAGNITQKISFSLISKEIIENKIGNLLYNNHIKLDIPGFLLIDTPGHAAFTNLRKRGGSLADMAVLVIDITEGIKPQTAEVIKILKHNKTPFIIALNKVDKISGWKSMPGKGLKESIENQPEKVKQVFNEKYMTLIGSLNSHGFDADLYYNIQDFRKKIALVPTSAERNEGIQELIMMLCGLSQKYLSERLKLEEDAKGVMLEIKKDKSTNYIEAILYDGELSRDDTLGVASFDPEQNPIISNIRILEEIEPLCDKFSPKDKVRAATGLRIQLSENQNEILPGMPFEVYKNNEQELKEKFHKQVSENIDSNLSKQGIIAKADSLGSLEALLTLLRQENIPVVKAGIGEVNKKDIISAKANLDINELDAIIVGFNVSISEEAKELSKEYNNIKTLTNDIIYKLIEDTIKFRQEKQKEIEKRRLMSLTPVGKANIFQEYVFRNSNPAIFGVSVEGGKIKPGFIIIDENNEKIGKIKNIQSENKSVNEASTGMEVAISIPGVNFERQLRDTNKLYMNISEEQFRKLRKNKDLLSQEEIKILQEIADIKRKENPEWGY